MYLLLKMMVFHCYVSLPEGKYMCFVVFWGVGSTLDVVSEGVETLNQIQLTINTWRPRWRMKHILHDEHRPNETELKVVEICWDHIIGVRSWYRSRIYWIYDMCLQMFFYYVLQILLRTHRIHLTGIFTYTFTININFECRQILTVLWMMVLGGLWIGHSFTLKNPELETCRKATRRDPWSILR